MERERNTAELIRDSKKGLIPYTTWAITFIGVTSLSMFLILASILGPTWILIPFGITVLWTAATAHGFRHGWLK